jgi:hypothetical protein
MGKSPKDLHRKSVKSVLIANLLSHFVKKDRLVVHVYVPNLSRVDPTNNF